MKTKIGKMPYINSDIFYIHREDCFEYVNYTPRQMGLAFEEGVIKAGPIATVDFFRINKAKLFEDLCVSTKESAKSVLLFSKKCKLQEITKVFITNQTSTSVNLLKVLSKYYWKIPNPLLTENRMEYDDCDAFLFIGDEALNMGLSRGMSPTQLPFNPNKSSLKVIDLGLEWFKYTSLPFVFAVWAYDDIPKEEYQRLKDSLYHNLRFDGDRYINIPIVSQRRSTDYLKESTITWYLNGFNYRMSKSENDSIDLFEQLYNNLQND